MATAKTVVPPETVLTLSVAEAAWLRDHLGARKTFGNADHGTAIFYVLDNAWLHPELEHNHTKEALSNERAYFQRG